METLTGTNVAAELAKGVTSDIAALGFAPHLVIIRVGDRVDSKSYVERKVAFGQKVGATTEVIHLPETVSLEEILAVIKQHNEAPTTHGIIVQLPLPPELNSQTIINAIAPEKDVDGLTDQNIALLAAGQRGGVVPATPRGILSLLNFYQVPIASKHVVVLGRSRLVGKSVALLLLNENATVTICHSQTTDLATITKTADILIVAIGKPRFITPEHVREGQVIIDVGIGADSDERLVGDVDASAVASLPVKLSPVPGGVGPMTVVSLFQNLVELAARQAVKE